MTYSFSAMPDQKSIIDPTQNPENSESTETANSPEAEEIYFPHARDYIDITALIASITVMAITGIATCLYMNYLEH